jgi:tight adherence protein B
MERSDHLLLLKVMLFLSLFLLFFSLLVGKFPEANSLKEKFLPHAASIGCAAVFFLIGTLLFQTPLSGLIWGVLGWVLPGIISGFAQERKKARLRSMARDFITSSAGLYAVGQMTSDVIRVMAKRFPQPLNKDFEEMLGKWNGSPYASFPRMFNELSQKYGINEFQAVSTILAASEQAGGPEAASKGLKRLGNALRQRDRLSTERAKAVMEPQISAIVTIAILFVGLLLDATVLREYYQGAGKLIMAGSSLLMVGLILMALKITKSEDLA